MGISRLWFGLVVVDNQGRNPPRREDVMTAEQHRTLRRLQGMTLCLALADGSRLDDVVLVSARPRTVWVFHNGEDLFLATGDVVDAWESAPARSAAA
jgi:hypothetical protein